MELVVWIFRLHKTNKSEWNIWLLNRTEAYSVARLLLNTTAVVAYPSGKLLKTFECSVIIGSNFLEPTTSVTKPYLFAIVFIKMNTLITFYQLIISKDIIPAEIDLPCSTSVHMFLLEQAQDKKRTCFLSRVIEISVYIWDCCCFCSKCFILFWQLIVKKIFENFVI